jgi:hypothetical protein
MDSSAARGITGREHSYGADLVRLLQQPQLGRLRELSVWLPTATPEIRDALLNNLALTEATKIKLLGCYLGPSYDRVSCSLLWARFGYGIEIAHPDDPGP